ncbi:MAG: AI-2E family transporter [Polyangiaceae bacterium]|nr:AI-2E family transporter [Polyangiaceae bacterium]
MARAHRYATVTVLRKGQPATLRTTEQLLYLVIVVGALLVAWPLLPWLLLALWVANLTRPIHVRLRRSARGTGRGAAIVVIGITIVVIAPIVASIVSLSHEAIDLGKKIASSEGGRSALASLVSDEGGDASGVSPRRVVSIVQQHGDRAWKVLSTVVAAATTAVIGLLMFLYGTYVALVDGHRAYEWFVAHLPLSRNVIDRFATAFTQTGRGLFIGVGVTGFVQAAIATITYVALDVPRALVLGLLTFIASILPSLGTALVWIPIAAGLAITGRTGAAIALTVVGVLVVGTVDNLMRPMIAHKADAHLPTFLLMLGMFGGLAAFGGWGVLLGPLLLRLGMEALSLQRESAQVAVQDGHS